MMHWRFIEDGALAGAENMAIDQALLEGVKAGGAPVLRFYRWAPAALSLGRNQVVPAPEAVRSAAAARQLDVVRRPTGGAGVLHDQELTYAVAAPMGTLGSPRESYVAINRALVAGLRRLGVAAEVAGGGGERRGGGRPVWDAPCFIAAAPGEVVVAGRKLVGSAQRSEGRTILQHGSILLGGDQGVVAACLGGNEGAAAFTTLGTLLDPVPTREALAAALLAGFEDALGVRPRPSALTAAESARAAQLLPHFRSEAWTWHRGTVV